MTRARALKQVIRARAAKTGERYTTARRHVLNDLGARSTTSAPPSALTLAPPAPEKAAPAPVTTKGGLSDAKSREKTGHGLDHWFAVLDGFGGVEKGHTALARHLYDEHAVPGWYTQGITVAYERARGARAVNQRCDGEFEVSASKVVKATTRDVAALLSDARLRRRWTKNVDADLARALDAGFTAPKSKGVVVRADGQGRFRYTWGATTVQLYLYPKAGGKVSVVVTNSKLADAATVETRRTLWRQTLDALAASAATAS
jgi:hypothetical protein